jgi:2-dehydropantoate 2-reductase
MPNELSGQLEWIFLAVKAPQTQSATRQLLPFLGENSFIVSLQNGLNERRIAAIVEAERTIGALVNWGADYLSPGHINHGQEGAFHIGELDGSITDRLKAINQTLSKFADTHITDNIWGYKWSKQVLASYLYATATVNADVAFILAQERYRRLMVALLGETVRVAKAYGVRLKSFDGFRPELMTPKNHSELQAALDSIAKMSDLCWQKGKRRTGTWRDMAVHKRKTELEYRLAEIVTLGKDIGFELPLNSRLIDIIREIEDGNREMNWDNLHELEYIIEDRKLLPS